MKLEDLTTIEQLTDFLSGGLFGYQRQGHLLPLDLGGGEFRYLTLPRQGKG